MACIQCRCAVSRVFTAWASLEALGVGDNYVVGIASVNGIVALLGRWVIREPSDLQVVTANIFQERRVCSSAIVEFLLDGGRILP